MADNGGAVLGSQLGQLLFGRNDNTSFLRGQQAGATVQDALMRARLARAKAINQEGQNTAIADLDTAGTKLGLTPDQAAGFQGLGQAGGGNAEVLAKALGLVRGQGYQADARTAALGGNLDQANANLVGLADKPLDLTKISGGMAYDPLVTPSASSLVVTPLGEADIGLKSAQAGASRASAANSYASAVEHNAHSRLFDKQTEVGGFNPKVGGDLGTMVVPPAASDPNAPTGDAYLKTISPGDAAMVKALSEGRLPFPTGTALKSPYWQGILQQVAQYDPTFDTTNAPARASTLKSFKGAGQNAQQINALQTFAEHVNLLGDNFDKLHNTSIPYLNSAINNVGSGLGLKNDVSAYNQNALNAAMELESLWKKGAGSEADIARSMANLSSASSPQQFKNAQQTLVKLAHGKLRAMRDQYIQGMGGTHNAMQFLDPRTQQIFASIDPEGAPTYENEASAPAGADIAAGNLGEMTAPPVKRTSSPGTVLRYNPATGKIE